MRSEFYDNELWELGKVAQKFMEEKYPKGVKREILIKKAKYYNDFYKKTLGNKSNTKSIEGFRAMWVLYLTDNYFIKPEDINDEVIKDYIKTYNSSKRNYCYSNLQNQDTPNQSKQVRVKSYEQEISDDIERK